MSYRSRKENKTYSRYTKNVQKAGVCEFCDIKEGDEGFVKELTYFKVIYNKFPYTFFDYHKITDHLLVIPKKHTDTISSFTADEALEYTQLVGDYEAKGYDVFSRAPSSKQKSVPHQHTHLIKPVGKEIKTMIYTKKPFIRVVH